MLSTKSILYSLSPSPIKGLFRRIEASPIGYRLARGTFWSLAGSLISRSLGLLATIVVGRLLGKEDFGALGVIQNTIALFGTLAGTSIGLTANKHIAEFKRTQPEKAGRILGVTSVVAWSSSALMAAILVIFAPWLATHTLAAPHLSSLLQFGAVLLFLSGLNGAQIGALSGFEAFKAIARINLIAGLVSFPLMVVGAWQLGIKGAMCALIASQIVNCVLCWFSNRTEARRFGIHPTYGGWRGEWRMLVGFSFPAVLTGLLTSLATWGASAFLVNQPAGYAEMGVYNAALRVKQLPEVLLAMLVAPMLPILSEAYAKRDGFTLQRTLLFNFLLAALIIIPAALLQAATPALTLMPFGSDYQGHHQTVVWLMLHAVLYSLLWPMGMALVSMGRMWFSLSVNVIFTIVFVVLAWLWVPHHGGAGYAAAMAIGYGIANLPCIIFLHRELPDVMRYLRWALMAGISVILFLLCAVVLRNLPFTWSLVGGTATALAFLVIKFKLHPSVASLGQLGR